MSKELPAALAPGQGVPGHERPDTSGIVLTRRRVFILPTRHGMAFAGMLVVMLISALNYSNSLGYMLTFLLGSLGMVSILHTYRNIEGIAVRGGVQGAVFAGEDAHFRLGFNNHEGPARYGICVSYSGGTGDGKWTRTVPCPLVPARGVQWVELPVKARQRGEVKLGRLTVATRYPFGLFRAWSLVSLDLRCLVFPYPSGSRELPASGGEAAREGSRRGRGRGDFSGFRDYLPGDSPRRIFWKAVARGQGIPVKLFTGTQAASLTLSWHDIHCPDPETRLSQLCQWVLEADRQGLKYALHLPGTEIPAHHGEHHKLACLSALARFEPGHGGY